MKKFLLVAAACLLLPVSFSYGWFGSGKEKDEIVDESKMPIMEDKPTVKNVPAVDEATDQWVKKTAAGVKGSLIKKYFKDNDTYVIICKGYPKDEALGMEARGTARSAALINAQMLGKEVFGNRLDVITMGSPEKYIDFEGFTVVYYVIRAPGLKKYAR